MLLGIRSQLTFLVIMLVSSTRLTDGLICAYTHISVLIYNINVGVNKQMIPKNLKDIIWATPERTQQGSWFLVQFVLCSLILA